MRKLIVLSLVLLIIAPMLAMAAASQETQGAGDDFDPADYQVAIATPGINHPVLRIVQLGFLQAAEELGYDAEVIGTDGWNMQDVYAAVDTFINTGGDALMLWAGDETAFPTYRKLEGAGIPVGTAHFRFEPHPQGLTFGLACDSVVYGREAADFIAERIKGQTGSVAITQHSSNTTEDASSAAFTARMRELNLPGVRVLEPEFEGGDLNAAININAAIIQRNPDIIAAFGLTGNSPVTWAGAAKAAGKAPGEIVIVGMDYTEANLALIESGEVAAIVAQPLYEEAYVTMEYLDTVLRGGTVPQWTPLDAPLVYKGGTGVNDPAYYGGILEEVKTWFQ
jgi:ribose transport system substrate-binding protein